MKLVVVDDRASRGQRIAGLARVLDAAEIQCFGSIQALDRVLHAAGTLVLVAIEGPRCGGVAFIQSLRAAAGGEDVPVLAVVEGGGTAMAAARRAGADDFIAYPPHDDELHARAMALAARPRAGGLDLSAVVDAMPLPAVISTVDDGHILAANRAILDDLGIDPKSFTSRRTTGLYVAPADRTRLMDQIRKTGQVRGFETHLYADDGSTRWTLISGRLLDVAGRKAVLCVIHDITDRKSAEQALAAREHQFRQIADTLPAMIYVTDAQGLTVFVNKPSLEYTGRTLEEVRGEGWLRAVHPEDRQGLVAVMERAARENTGFEHEYRALTADGTYRWQLNRGEPLHDDNGTQTGLIGVCIDITDRRRVQEELLHSQERNRLITDMVPAPIAYVDADEVIRYVNLAYARRFSRTPAEMVGRRLTDLIGADAAAVLRPFNTRALSGQHTVFEGTLDYDSIGTRYCRIFYVPHIVEGGRVAGYFGLVHDITETKRIEAELRQAKETAERANLAKSRFLAAASHDLRQPLNAMSLLLGLLRPHLEPGRPDIIASQMQDSLDAMIDLFNSLLDISRFDMGAATARRGPVEIAALLERLRMDFAGTAQDKGIEFRVVPCGLTLSSDPALLERILRNFVSNAVRYTERGRVVIGCRRRGDRVQIEVRDTGAGIAPDQLPHVFEEFYQLGNPARERREGHGLGLAIARRAADLLGHRLHADSRLGAGSCFAVEVPVERPAGEPDADAADVPVLLIEDDPLVLTAMRLTLEEMGCPVLAARSLAEAQAALDAEPFTPRLVLADYRLPGGADGLTVIAALRQRFGATFSACIVTGDMQADIREQVEAAGARFLNKPIRPDDIRAIISAARRPPARTPNRPPEPI